MHTTKGYQNINCCYLCILDYGAIFIFFFSIFPVFFNEDLLLLYQGETKGAILKKEVFMEKIYIQSSQKAF